MQDKDSVMDKKQAHFINGQLVVINEQEERDEGRAKCKAEVFEGAVY